MCLSRGPGAAVNGLVTPFIYGYFKRKKKASGCSYVLVVLFKRSHLRAQEKQCLLPKGGKIMEGNICKKLS